MKSFARAVARLRIWDGFRNPQIAPPALGQAVSPPALPYRKDIDGLRGIAVTLVLLFHFDLGSCFRAGFVGVDIFFVISGFLIGCILRRQIPSGSFHAADFYVRRIRRLAPALVATVVLSLVAGYVLMTPTELEKLGAEATAAQLYVSNIYYWRFLSYFGLQADQSVFLHTWSLGVEEQFYLLFPLLLIVLFRSRSNVAVALLAIGLASFAMNVAAVGWKPSSAFYLLPTRVWEFAAGALVPEVMAIADKWHLRRGLIAATGVLALATTLVTYHENTPFPGWFAALPVAATVALLVAGADPHGFYGKVVSSPIPVYVGRISYELYLVHWPVRVFAPLLLFSYSLTQRTGCLLICFPLSAAIYHLLSKPIRRRKILELQRNALGAYLATTLAVVAVALAARLTHGFPQRLQPAIASLASAANDQNVAYRHCETSPMGSCRLGFRRSQPTWFIYGDSHADALAGAFSTYLRSQHQAAYFAFQSGCLPVQRSGDRNCRRFNNDAFHFLEAHPQIHFVALVSTWRQPLEAGFTDETGALVSGQSAITAFDRSLSHTLLAFRTAGKQIIIWMPVPGARKSVPGALTRNAILSRTWDIRYRRTEYDQTFHFLSRDLKKTPGVTLIETAPYICRNGECAISHDRRPLYFDEAHPAGSQAPFFSQIIGSELRKSAGS